MSISEEIQQIINNGSLNNKITETLSPLEETLRSEIYAEMQQIHSEFMSLTEDVLDESELRRALVLRYIELKSRWIMYNTRLQFRLLLTGDSDDQLVYTASAISLFLEAMEQILTQRDVESINQFLVEPVSRFREEPSVVEMPVTIKVKHNSTELSGISILELRRR